MIYKSMVMFPGQGSQYVGMGKNLFDNFKNAKLIFEQAEDILKLNIKKLCFEGPEEELKITYNTQPCILTVSIATWEVLCEETGLKPEVFAGHSLGEYSALVASDTMPFCDAIKLVRKRGEFMQEVVGIGTGAMVAVMNMNEDELKYLCKQINSEQSIVEIVNYNSPQQLVVAGHKQAIDELCNKLQERSIKYIPLQVSAPFHSSLMHEAKLKMKPLLESTILTKPKGTIIPNLTAEPCETYDINYLIEQIDHPVLWTQTLNSSQKLGCTLYVEVGPSKVLAGLAKRTLSKDCIIVTTDNINEGIQKLNSILR